jgi:hypothetical protein
VLNTHQAPSPVPVEEDPVTSPTQSPSDNSARNATAFTVATFAGILLLIVGSLQVLEGISAVAKDDVYVAGINYVYEFDITAWGWIHIVLGAIGVAAGVGILMNQTWAQVTGIGFACLSALANFAFLPYYPLWAIVVIAFNVLVIWALAQQASTGGRRA